MIFVRLLAIYCFSFGVIFAMNLSQINKATKDELMKIKGIGEAKADLIIKSRPFKTKQNLDDVKGIGVVLLGNIEHDVYKKSASNSNTTTQNQAKVASNEIYEEEEPKRKKVNVIHFNK
jgi:competence protein ComEA